MRIGKKFLVLSLIFSTFVLLMPTIIQAGDAPPSPSITKHLPEVQTSPEKSTETGISWWWWALGILVVAGGIAAAAGGGGGGGGSSSNTQPTTGSATVTW